jgi:hypothetical protein
MSCRRRRIYKDRDARISILAPETTSSDDEAGYIAADCPPTLHNPLADPGRAIHCRPGAGHTLQTRGGPYIEPATFRL